MTDENNDEDLFDQNDEYSETHSTKSTNSFTPTALDDEDSIQRASSSLNNYSVLPPIKSANREHSSEPPQLIKTLQEKYLQSNGTSATNNAAKLDDAYLKMKRLDKALEEAFEKEKQVKNETMSLMRKLRSEMQSMTVALNSDSHESSHTQLNLKRFLALDDEILKLDGSVIEDDNLNPAESIFKTQLSDNLSDSRNTNKTNKDSPVNSNNSNAKGNQFNRKKKSSVSSTSTTNSKDKSKKPSKLQEKDYIKRNIELAKELGGTWALTDSERQRLNELLDEDEQENAVALTNQQMNGYVPLTDDAKRLKEIDDLLEKEYYNPLLNHQLRRHNDNDIDYKHMLQITNEENEQIENPFGEQILKETRLQREHTQRLKKIDEQLERLHRPVIDENVEAILTDAQLNELLGQCTVDQMKQHYSLLNNNKDDSQPIDFNGLSDYVLTHYIENDRGPLITDEIIQLLIHEAQQEGINMRTFNDEEDEENNIYDYDEQPNDLLSLAPAIDRPISSTSTSSHVDLYNRNLQ